MKFGIVPALILGLGAPLVATPVAHAEPLFILPGAEYVKLDKSLPNKPAITKYYTFGIDIGKGFFPNATPSIVAYPASIFLRGSIAKHVDQGATNLEAAFRAHPGPSILVGQSEGAVSIDIEQARLENDPTAPAADQLVFSVFSDPMRGIMNTLFKDGTKIPLIGLVAQTPVESRYDTVVVTNEYDLWSDFPNRPWNVLALINALSGATLTHARASDAPSDVPAGNITVTTNSLGGKTTSYLVPAQQLPLTAPLRLVLPGKLVDAIDKAVKPAIDSAYTRHDAPGSTKPYMSHGVIRRGTDPAPTASAAAHVPAASATAQETVTNRMSQTAPKPAASVQRPNRGNPS